MTRKNSMVRRGLKAAVANVLHYSGLRAGLAAVRRYQAGGRRIVIVGYHRVVEDFTGEVQRSIPGTLISIETLQRHLEDARRAGFEIASLDDALDVMSGRRRARSDLFVVTFDDGYEGVYDLAFPLFKRMGVHATIYLPTGFVGTNRRFSHDRLFHLMSLVHQKEAAPMYAALPPTAPALFEPVRRRLRSPSASLDDFIADHSAAQLIELIEGLEHYLGAGAEVLPSYGGVMNWSQVRTMANQGFTFGAHTVNHVVVTLADDDTMEREIVESKQTIETELGRKVEHFAYCNGWYSDRVVATLVRHGFKSAVTTEDYPNVIGGNPFALKRKVLWENFSVGFDGGYSGPLTACQLDDVFGILGVSSPLPGWRNDLKSSPLAAPRTAALSTKLDTLSTLPPPSGGGAL